MPAGALLLILLLAARPPAADPWTIRSAVQELEKQGTVPIGKERICAAGPVVQFYSRRSFAAAWSPATAATLLEAVANASRDGLRPADYHRDAIAILLRESSRRDELDLLLTDAFLLLASHLVAGRVDPATIIPTWCLTPRSIDVAALLETALDSGDIEATLDRVTSTHEGYRQLRAALARHRQFAERGGWAAIDPGPPLRKSGSGRRVDQLVTRLQWTDLPAGRHSDFDSAVEEAVRRFQRRHGLASDGIVGPRTTSELNVPADERVRQIILNLERWRWLPADLGVRHALVNIPEFQLRVRENGDDVLAMRIVVGVRYQRTPVFSGTITSIVFNPSWTVPESIARKELLPAERRHPGYLARRHIEVLPNGALRQRPGPWNALGTVKFFLQNAYAVYLHDTPERDLFNEPLRAFSHGCIRLELPFALAGHLLRDDPQWTRERIERLVDSRRETTVVLRAPLPVHVLYWTAFVGDGGELNFRHDVYGRDPELEKAMKTVAGSR